MLEYLPAVIFFGIAAYQDWKYRIVENKVWLIYLPIALLITTFSINSTAMLIFTVGFVAISSALAVGLFYANVWGGADAKAFICLSIGLTFDSFFVLVFTILFSLIYLVKLFKAKDKREYPIVSVLFVGIVVSGLLNLFGFL